MASEDHHGRGSEPQKEGRLHVLVCFLGLRSVCFFRQGTPCVPPVPGPGSRVAGLRLAQTGDQVRRLDQSQPHDC